MPTAVSPALDGFALLTAVVDVRLEAVDEATVLDVLLPGV